MPIHIEDMSSDVSVLDGDGGLPLSQAQVERLVELVCGRLAERELAARRADEGSAVRSRIAPALGLGDR